MTLRRVTIWLQTSEPSANDPIIATAVKVAGEHGAELNAIITTPKLSRSGHWAVGGMVSSMAAEVESRAESAAQNLVHALDQARVATGLRGVSSTQALAPHLFGEFVAVKGRTSDLIITGATADEETRSQIEALIFAVARPVLLLPTSKNEVPNHTVGLDKVALAWDGGRSATRAVFDALPLLKRARQVTLLQVADDKDLSRTSSVAELGVLLERHGVTTTALEIFARGKPTAIALKEALQQSGADLLVMGAYGHSRAREFILGGATRGTLQAAAFPVLLSH